MDILLNNAIIHTISNAASTSIFSGKALMLYIAIILGVGLLASIIFAKVRFVRNITVLASIGATLGLVIRYFAVSKSSAYLIGPAFFRFRFDPFSNFFVVLTLGVAFVALLASWSYMKEKKGESFFYIFFMVTIIGMVGLIYARDMISFFIGWEVMTIGSFIVILQGQDKDRFKHALRYFIISLIGAYALLWTIFIIHNKTNSFSLYDFNLSLFNKGELITIIIGITVGFLIKAAAMPFHFWAPGAYSRSPLTFTAFFSGAMSKMGIYGLLIFLYMMIGSKAIYETGSIEFFHTSVFMYVIVWLGVITTAAATLKAIFAEDMREMLAYSSVGQLGYMIIGIGVGTTLGLTATLYQVVIHGLFKTTLFIVIAAVIYRTGKTKYHELGGLIFNMPIAFVATLMAIITLAGIPPLAGFTSKWLIYNALLEKKMVFATVVTMMASVGAFLYVYRLIQSLFFGQRKVEHDDVKKAPLTMQIAMMIPVVGMLVLGFFPNWLIRYTNIFVSYLKDVKAFRISGDLMDANLVVGSGYWNAFYVGSTIMIAFIVAIIYYNLYRRGKIYRVGQLDIYTAGEYVTRETPLNYSFNFYGFLKDALAPWFKFSITAAVARLAKEFNVIADFIRRINTGNGQHYAIFTMIFLVITLVYFLG